jgi:O-antigen ligase
MSVPARLLTVDPTARVRVAVPALGWAVVASLVALVEATAAFIDPKLGVAVAVTLIVGAIVASRPALLLPLAVITVYFEGLSFNDQPVTRLLAPGALFLVLAEVLRGTGRIRLGSPLAWVSAYVAWAFASGLWSASLPGTRFLLQSLAIALVFLVAFAALLNSEEQLERVLYVLAFAASLMGGLSVLAFAGFFGPDAAAIPQLELLQGGRSQGAVDDPDFFAAMQIVALPLVLVLASQEKDRRMRVVLYAGVLAILASIFTSLSRGGFIALILFGILLLASNPENVFRSRREKGLALLVVAVGLVAFFSRPFVRDQVTDRVQSIYAPKNRNDASGSGRTNLWKAAARTAEENPLLGIGYGSFKYVSEELIYHTPGVDLEVYGNRSEGDNFMAHNSYLGTAAELGITGLLLYLGVMLSTGWALRRTAARAFAAGKPFIGRVAHALLLGLAGWAVATFFLSAETARMFWIIVGLSLALPKLLGEPASLERLRTASARSLLSSPTTSSHRTPDRGSAPSARRPLSSQATPPIRAPVRAEPQPSFVLPVSRPAPVAPVAPVAIGRPVLHGPETPKGAPRDAHLHKRRRRPGDLAVQAFSVFGLGWALVLLALILSR